MKKNLLYIFIFSFFFCGFSQNSTENLNRYGLRVGADVSKLARSFIDKDYFGLELVADYRWKYNTYFAGEIGKEYKKTITDYFSYTTDGQYIKLGADHNTYGNWYGMENMIFIGGRYGFANFSQTLNEYQIRNLNRYWQENPQGNSPEILKKYSGRTAHWLEFLVGMKAEVLQNLYLGVSVRFSRMIYHTQNEFPNYWISGVGRVWESSNFGINYNYTITYLIPFYKKKNQPKENQK